MISIDNYQTERKTVNIYWANVFAVLIILPILFLFGLPYFFIWEEQILSSLKDGMDNAATIDVLWVFVWLIGGIVVHELIHGLVWARFASTGFKSIKFGVLWKMITPYCHCKEPLKIRHYILGALMPSIILGLLPAVLAIILENSSMLLFGMFFTMVAAGDFLIVFKLRKEDPENYVQDHPSEAGCFVYRKPDSESSEKE